MEEEAERFKAAAEEQCRQLFRDIDALNAAEDRQYINTDLEERGLSAKEITAETIREQAGKLNQVITSCDSKKQQRNQ